MGVHQLTAKPVNTLKAFTGVRLKEDQKSAQDEGNMDRQLEQMTLRQSGPKGIHEPIQLEQTSKPRVRQHIMATQ